MGGLDGGLKLISWQCNEVCVDLGDRKVWKSQGLEERRWYQEAATLAYSKMDEIDKVYGCVKDEAVPAIRYALIMEIERC